MPDLLEVLIEEGLAEATAGIGEQRLDRPSPRSGIEPVDALDVGEISLDRVHLYAQRAEIIRRIIDRGFVGGDQKVEAVLGALAREFIADAA